MLLDEGRIEHAFALQLGRVVGGEYMLADAQNDRDVATDLDLMVLTADDRFLAGQHLGGILRIDERLEALFADRIEGDDLNAAFGRLLQGVQESRAVRTRILAEEKHRIAFGKIIEYGGADANADRLFEGHARGLVTHVRRVREIVCAVEAAEQRIEVGGFEARSSRRIEDDGVGIERLQLLADALESLLPFAWHVMIALGVIAHRMGQASLLLEIVVAPIAQLGHGVLGKKIGGAAKRGQLPQRRLGAILAKLKGVVVGGLRPRARSTHEAFRLVLPHQGFECCGCVPFLSEDLGNPLQGSPAASGPIIFHGGAGFVQYGFFLGHDPVLPIASRPGTLSTSRHPKSSAGRT